MGKSKVVLAANQIGGKILIVVGWLWVVIIFLALVLGIFESDTDDGFLVNMFLFVMGFLLTAWPGILCIVFGLRTKRRIQRFKEYVAILSSQSRVTVSELANKTGNTVEFVQRDLYKMIYKKYFVNAHIDAGTGEIVIGHLSSDAVPQQAQSQAAQPTVDMESFNCTQCSATGKKPKGASGICDYCGTIIS